MNAKKCDRCGKYYENSYVERRIIVGVDRYPYQKQ